jgi:hypothetical protein
MRVTVFSTKPYDRDFRAHNRVREHNFAATTIADLTAVVGGAARGAAGGAGQALQ